jgi:hypothetical protein
MYDQYLTVTPISIDGTAIPKNKGILVNNGTAGNVAVNFYFRNKTGNTFQVGLTFATGNNILPIQPYGIPASLPAGVTAFYLN